MPEQRDLMLIKYMEWLEKLPVEFPEVLRPSDVNEDWWRLMLLAYERKPVSGKSLWRKFKEDTRNPILSSFNVHWADPRENETLEDRFKVVRRGVWRDLGHRDDEFLPEGTWLPKQWYAWRYCCYPGKNFRAFDGKLPSAGPSGSAQRQRSAGGAVPSHRLAHSNDGAMNWAAALPIENMQSLDAAMIVSSVGLPPQTSATGSSSNGNGTLRINRATLPTTSTNQRLLAAAASMSRVRSTPEDEVSVQHYLADVQQYVAQMTRLEKAAALAEEYGDLDKAAGFKRQLYEHVQAEPPARLKRAHIVPVGLHLPSGIAQGDASMDGSSQQDELAAAMAAAAGGDHTMDMHHLHQQQQQHPLHNMHGSAHDNGSHNDAYSGALQQQQQEMQGGGTTSSSSNNSVSPHDGMH